MTDLLGSTGPVLWGPERVAQDATSLGGGRFRRFRPGGFAGPAGWSRVRMEKPKPWFAVWFWDLNPKDI